MTDDLISRKAAIKALGEALDHIGCLDEEDVAVVLGHLSAAQPEIIYCKDCKYCSYDSIFDQSWCNYTSGVRKVKPTDFCSCGKRRTNEGSD